MVTLLYNKSHEALASFRVEHLHRFQTAWRPAKFAVKSLTSEMLHCLQ